jgi:hypothetical protein
MYNGITEREKENPYVCYFCVCEIIILNMLGKNLANI